MVFFGLSFLKFNIFFILPFLCVSFIQYVAEISQVWFSMLVINLKHLEHAFVANLFLLI